MLPPLWRDRFASTRHCERVTPIARGDVTRPEAVLHKMKQQLIRLDAVPGTGSPVNEE
jgi:hypothetical protein